MRKRAIIIGAGPAGLTAALEMLRHTDILPIIVEASDEIGGISRTIRYKGNRMDIGGHRFFSKSDRVMQWWMDLMPPEASDRISYQGKTRTVEVPADLPQEPVLRGAGPLQPAPATDSPPHIERVIAQPPADPDLVMLIRPRKSRIYYLRRFFDYPISLTAGTLGNLGVTRTVRVSASYLYSRLHQIEPEKSLADFLINRFGRELYLTFFKSYTEKVWGTPCDQISAEWGAQRIKGLSLTTAIKHFLQRSLKPGAATPSATDVAQKSTNTSLIERFLYPKLGPGQLWEHVAQLIVEQGGEIHKHAQVDRIETKGSRVTAITTLAPDGSHTTYSGDLFLSTMPMRDLIQSLDADIPPAIREIAEGLQYRDFITVGLLCDRLKVEELDGGLLKDTWIYVQEPDVLLGRLQIFNNWSPHLVSDPTKVWIGLEYFCYDTDDLWKMQDSDLQKFAIAELAQIGIITPEAVTDAHVVRVPKTYPAYFGTYNRFDELRAYTDTFENLYLIGRNGMHKYNNQDHSMLTAMTLVDGLRDGRVDKQALWSINTEQEYHEHKEAKQ